MKKEQVDTIKNIALSTTQLKAKLENSLAYDHSKYKNVSILFDTKPHLYYKLPFSDFKISISEELANQQLLLENLHNYISEYKLLEENVEEEVLTEVVMDEDDNLEDDINVVEEINEYDDFEEDEDEKLEYLEYEDEDEEEDEEEEEIKFDGEIAKYPDNFKAKKPKGTFIKVVDVKAVIEEIRQEALEKNKGKPIIGRRQINKMLKPYMIKKASNIDDIDGLDDSLTSIDIYLNAVDKIANTSDAPLYNNNDTLELNIKDILSDLKNKD